jgi:flagellin-like protein
MIKHSKTKKSQSEVVTSVLLVLIAIAAVTILSAFVINMVKNNLKGTDCFDSMGQITINVDGGWTFFNSTSKNLYVNVERGSKSFNLTKLAIIFGTDGEQKSITISPGSNKGVYPADNISNPSPIINLPGPGEATTYVINISSLSNLKANVSKVSVAPILINDVQCDKADEKNVQII